MKSPTCLASACRYCRFYQPEGRRGGFCQQLGAPVRGSWKACALALPPFAPSWERLEAIMLWQQEMVVGPDALPVEGSFSGDRAESSERPSVPSSVKSAVTAIR